MTGFFYKLSLLLGFWCVGQSGGALDHFEYRAFGVLDTGNTTGLEKQFGLMAVPQ